MFEILVSRLFDKVFFYLRNGSPWSQDGKMRDNDWLNGFTATRAITKRDFILRAEVKAKVSRLLGNTVTR